MPRVRRTDLQLGLFDAPPPAAGSNQVASDEQTVAARLRSAPESPVAVEQLAPTGPKPQAQAPIVTGDLAASVPTRRVRVPRPTPVPDEDVRTSKATVQEMGGGELGRISDASEKPSLVNVDAPLQGPASDTGERSAPWSYFTSSHQLNADEATRAVQGRSLGYVGIRWHLSRAVMCRDCHQTMTAGTGRYVPDGFAGQGYVAPVYTCEQRKPNVDSKCTVCGELVIGEVMNG